MKKINLMDKYPVYIKEVLKSKTKFKNVDEYIEALKQKIEADEIATYIGIFDNFEHTNNIGWKIMEWMIAGKILLFCFGPSIETSQVMAIRPRNIAIAEFKDKFVISFLEAPIEKANKKEISWILEYIED